APMYRVLADDPSVETAMFVAAHDTDAYAATRRASGDASTTARAVIGTPGFMAPEIIELAEPTAATDAYALAVCVVQLATGRLPQGVEDEPEWNDPSSVSDWMDRVRATTLRGVLRDLAADPANLPRGLVALLMRLLSVDQAKRGVTAGKLREAFESVWE